MPLTRVDVRQASAEAIGILVPPGHRTLVVVRPRTHDWDLVPVRWSGDPSAAPTFCDFGRDEAALVARRLGKFLEDCDSRGVCPVETLGHASAFQVWLRAEDLFWMLCARLPGSAYRAMIFSELAEARAAAERVARLLSPGPARHQHYYFNTQNFAS
jgi:hypothetical protein